MKLKQILPMLTLAAAPLAAQTDGGIDTANMNPAAVPGADFYDYACGGWMKANPLPAEYARYGSFEQLIENNDKQLRGLIEELAAKKHAPGSIEQKIADLYNSAMDSVGRNERGAGELREILAPVAGAKTREELFRLVATWQRKGLGSLIDFYIDADIKNSSMNLLQFYQSGLTLGEREYYLDGDKATLHIREQYRKHVERMFRLAGFDRKTARRKRDAVLAIETRMAHPFYSAVQLRDPEANYHKMTYAELKRDYAGVDWDVYFDALGIKGVGELSVSQPEPLKEACLIWKEAPLDDLKAYVEWKFIDGAATCLSDDFVAANFDFYGRVMSGKEQDRPRWKKAVGAVESGLGEALGRIYVERYFPAEAKQRMETLVQNLQVALAERILAQEWMSNSTKLAALEKLSTFYVKVGYPDTWRDYSALDIRPTGYLENMQRCSAFAYDDMLRRRLGKPVDRKEWLMTPQTINAYYNPTTNEICFPAGILQPPFFDMQRDDAFNYGAIGVVIGHEMTHGFDDQGRQFDKDGNLADWWAPGDADRFKERADVMEAFFGNIDVLPDLKANGALTLGENLADHGGLMVAYQAFKNATKAAPLPAKDGLTPEQRFFLAYAQVWAANIRDEEIRQRTKSDPHSLGRWRVNGALPHIDMWYEAFGVTDKDPMFVPADKRVRIW
ncbi:MAG: M13 family metallopeptidase [Paraprevotella sp.]|nr:M13 family metallopeptidase [Paraprevotella sp.]